MFRFKTLAITVATTALLLGAFAGTASAAPNHSDHGDHGNRTNICWSCRGAFFPRAFPTIPYVPIAPVAPVSTVAYSTVTPAITVSAPTVITVPYDVAAGGVLSASVNGQQILITCVSGCYAGQSIDLSSVLAQTPSYSATSYSYAATIPVYSMPVYSQPVYSTPVYYPRVCFRCRHR